MTKKSILSALLAVMLVVACTQGQEKQQLGTLVGAGLGALIGSQIGSGRGQLAGVAIGAVAGGWLGGEFGKGLDEADRAAAERTTQTALENNQSGQMAAWRNPDSGNSGTLTPVKTYKADDGADCREFDTTVIVDGNTEAATGRACRQSDGSWRIVP